jgi:hypothetical protein
MKRASVSQNNVVGALCFALNFFSAALMFFGRGGRLFSIGFVVFMSTAGVGVVYAIFFCEHAAIIALQSSIWPAFPHVLPAPASRSSSCYFLRDISIPPPIVRRQHNRTQSTILNGRPEICTDS